MRLDEIVGLDARTEEPAALAKRHGVPLSVITNQLAKGVKVELEHTSNRAIAREIALDHLKEDPAYYDKLAVVEISKDPDD